MDPVIYKSVANFVFGFLIVTVRSYVAAKLRNGDLADRKIGAMFASPLDKMLAKLFEISHQELRISITHLKQGIRRLNLVLGGDIFYSARKSSSQVNVVKISHAASETVKEVLVHHEGNKDDYQKGHKYDLYLKRKKEAIESFKQAAVEALKALCNRDLEPEEHIIASYVLLACTILGNLDDREQAVIDCWGNLEELHDIPAIHKTFLAHANGGWRSRFLKESRNKIIESIVDIHSIIFYFISKFSEKRIGVLDWPMVGCDTLAINPILYQETKLYYNLKDKKEDHPSLWQSNKLNDKEIPNPSLNCSFDSKGNLVCILTNKDEKHVLGKLNSTSGELQQFSSSIDVTSKDIEYCSVAVDDDDQVYLLSRHDSCYKLSVYTKDGILSYHRRLTFLKGRVLCYLAVTKEKKIVICCENDFGENIVYLYKTSEDHPLHNEEYTTLARSHSIMLQNVGYTARSTTHSTQPQSEESSTRSTSHSTPPQNEESSTRSTSHSTPPQNEESSASHSTPPQNDESSTRSTSHSTPPQNEESSTRSASHSTPPQNEESSTRSASHSTPPQNEESSTRSTSHSTPPQNDESSTRSASHSPPPQNEESSTRSTSHSTPPQNEESSTRSTSHSTPPQNEESSTRSASHSTPPQNEESSTRSTSHSTPPQNEESSTRSTSHSTPPQMKNLPPDLPVIQHHHRMKNLPPDLPICQSFNTTTNEESSTRSTSHSTPPQNEESSTRSASHSTPPQNEESSTRSTTRSTSHSTPPQNEESSTRSASHSTPPQNEESSTRSTSHSTPPQNEESSTRSTSHSTPPQNEESSTRSTSHSTPPQNEESSTRSTSHSTPPQNEESSTRSTSHSTPPQNEESSTRSTSHSTPPQNEESSTRSTSHSTPPQNEESSARSTSQTKRFALNLKNHSIEGMFVSRDNEIIIAAINYTEKSREVYIYIYSEDGYRKTSLKFRPSKGNNCYLSICWDQDSKDIIGYTVSNDRIFVDHLSVETGEIHCSYLLNSMNFPDNISSFHLVCHANGRLALVQEKHVILLRSK
ncbi:uncharacterized protein LOC114529305 [Dendronephthya gigantea]|uniref:uncharacterized protein LOC114529305 n=1 Tax=Dendronephthya gigantea TaxID=151771 RepID=UPI00106BCDD9|nr:uncharacterized protein LOC114529305 [Dendronephthya gigantea]